jgi:beta propeller repeat protein
MKDLNGKNPEKIVYKGTGDQTNPDKSGKYVVWQDKRYSKWQIYYKDITTTSSAKPVYPNKKMDQTSPRIQGNNIVWKETVITDDGWGPVADISIVTYNLVTHKFLTVERSLGCAKDADIYKNLIVYRQESYGRESSAWGILYLGSDIKLLDLTTKNKKTIKKLDATVTLSSPLVYGDHIIYISKPADGSTGTQTYLFDYVISTGITKTILSTNKDVDLSNSSILANYVVWQQKNSSKQYICITDIGKNNPISVVSTGITNSNSPTISGYVKAGVYVVWKGDYNGKSVLFYRNMDPNPPWIKLTHPKHGETGFNRAGTILIRFNKFISPSTNYTQIKVINLSTNQNIPISKTIKEDILYIKPKTTMQAKNLYQIVIPLKSVKDNAYNNLQTTKTITFRTGA